MLSIEAHQQLLVSNAPDCNLFCGDGYVIDFRTCACVGTWSSGIKRKIRSSDSSLMSKLIRNDETTSKASYFRCNNDEQWNGSACVSSISLCPGGYHWNGHACIIQSLIQTAVLVPSAPDTRCKNAKMREAEQIYMHLPLTAMPIYSTSPLCPFAFVWDGSRCVRNPPTCPNGYSYYGNTCHLKVQQAKPTNPETTTQPSTDAISRRNQINGNKWQQMPFASDANIELISRYEHTVNNPEIERSEDGVISRDQNQPCCSIMSPRICRRISNKTGEWWQCYNRKHRGCGDYCTKPNIYLRPKKSSFIEPLLIMPPPPRRLQKLLQQYLHQETNIGKGAGFFILLEHFNIKKVAFVKLNIIIFVEIFFNP